MAAADHNRLRDALQAAATRTLDALRDQRDRLPPPAADRLLAAGADLHARIAHLSRHGFGPARCRIHGDLRLARVLVAGNEPVLIDAGGPAHVPAAERRVRQPPLTDLGTLICDLHTAVADIRQRMQAEHPDLYTRLIEPLAIWRRETVDRLLSAHAAAAVPAPSPLLDPDPQRSAAAARALALGCALDRLDTAIAAGPSTPSTAPAAALETVLSLLHDTAEPAAPAG
jgi:predicted trehalose synthase